MISKDSKQSYNEDRPKLRLSGKIKEELVNKIIKQTTFLFDDKINHEISKIFDPEEKFLMKLNVLRKVFSLKNKKEVGEFLKRVYLNTFNHETNKI